jgi:hypothetical protein
MPAMPVVSTRVNMSSHSFSSNGTSSDVDNASNYRNKNLKLNASIYKVTSGVVAHNIAE